MDDIAEGPVGVCVAGRGDLAEACARELSGRLGDHVITARLDTSAEVVQWANANPDLPVAVVIIVIDGGRDVDDEFGALVITPELDCSRKLVVTDRDELSPVWALDGGHIDGMVTAPWPDGVLARYVSAQMARWWRTQGPAERALPTGVPDPTPRSDLLRILEQPTEETSAELLSALEEVLGPRTRVRLPPGVRITIQERAVDNVYLVLKGEVSLRAGSRAGKLTMHQASTGPLVGLMGLAERQRSSVTATTATDCELVQLTVEQLDQALAENPRVGTALTALSIRALAARLRRAQAQHRETAELAAELATALDQLEQARAELVDQARMATLGEMSAGIAHELNNPIAAVARGTDQLRQDLGTLVAQSPDAELISELLTDAAQGRPTSAKEERALRREVARQVGDPALARRLVAAGITEPDLVKAVAAMPPDRLAIVESAAGIKATLESMTIASRHICGLVDTLRRHARPDGPAPEPVVVIETVQDSLKLLNARLKGLTVTVHDETQGAAVLCHPGRLIQVWTNLIVNAADALAGSGSIDIVARRTPDGAWVEVLVADDGPGIPPEVLERIFNSRFTTKHGVVRFGLGLGLSIARSIVSDLDGRIDVTSTKGETIFSVALPIHHPKGAQR